MNRLKPLFKPEKNDPRINASILSPKITLINAVMIMLYSGLLLAIFYSIEFIPENGFFLAASILTLITVASVSISALINYIHYNNYTRPILSIAEAARKVSNGDYKIQLPKHRHDGKTDEIDALYQDFNTMVNDLNSTEILKSSFISNVSHELKTPIAIISNYSTLLSNAGLSKEKEKEYISRIRTATSDLSELITNILQITKLDNNQITVNPSEFNISELLIQCILGYDTILEEKNIDLQPDIPEELFIKSDQGLLKITVNNIFSNALKFTPSSGIIKISLKQDDSYTTISFKDNGCGMDEDTIRHIFEKFYRGSSSHSVNGNGLGLAMVKQIVSLLNGDISVESTPGTGSLFILTIPNSYE